MASANKLPVSTPAESVTGGSHDDEERILLTLNLDPKTNALLDDLARKIHGTKGEVFRKAVGLFKVALDAVEEGKRIGSFGPDQELDSEFVGF